MRRIDSNKNQLVLDMRALHTAKGRIEQNAFLAEGQHLAEELVKSGITPRIVLASDSYADDALLQRFEDGGADVARAPERCLEAACDTRTPQGIACVVGLPAEPEPAANRRLIALDGVQDPGNVGTILRLCGAAGWDGVLLSNDCADAFAPKTVRASMGAVFRVPVWRGDLAPELMRLKESAHAIVIADMVGDPFYARADIGARVLVIGAEGRGLSPEVRACATHTYALPMPGHSESLNAAMAAAIMVYDFVRVETEI